MSIEEIAAKALELAQGLAPAALGSAVAQAYKKGLGWKQRLVQWFVGICVSYFVTPLALLALTPIVGPNDFVAQGCGFVLGVIAFEATPKFMRGAVDLAGKLPGEVLNMIPGRRK